MSSYLRDTTLAERQADRRVRTRGLQEFSVAGPVATPARFLAGDCSLKQFSSTPYPFGPIPDLALGNQDYN